MGRQMGQPGGLEVGTRMVCFSDREEFRLPRLLRLGRKSCQVTQETGELLCQLWGSS